MTCRCKGWGVQDVESLHCSPCGPGCVVLLKAGDFTAFQRSLDNPPPPTEKLRKLMGAACELWNEEVERGLSESDMEMIARLK